MKRNAEGRRKRGCHWIAEERIKKKGDEREIKKGAKMVGNLRKEER